jgi:DNA-binding response OmpR family regulator
MTVLTAEAGSILVVDDVHAVCALVKKTLSELPYPVVAAHSVRAAKKALQKGGIFKAMVIDFGLPDGTGMDVVAEARRLYPNVPILVISGFDVGPLDVDFMQKPFDPAELLNRVEEMAAPTP